MTVSRETIAYAHRLADISGAVIRPYFRAPIAVAGKAAMIDGKPVFDPVTEADKGGERAIRAAIEAERPDDGILGEEYGEKPSKNVCAGCWTRWTAPAPSSTAAMSGAR